MPCHVMCRVMTLATKKTADLCSSSYGRYDAWSLSCRVMTLARQDETIVLTEDTRPLWTTSHLPYLGWVVVILRGLVTDAIRKTYRAPFFPTSSSMSVALRLHDNKRDAGGSAVGTWGIGGYCCVTPISVPRCLSCSFVTLCSPHPPTFRLAF